MGDNSKAVAQCVMVYTQPQAVVNVMRKRACSPGSVHHKSLHNMTKLLMDPWALIIVDDQHKQTLQSRALFGRQLECKQLAYWMLLLAT